MKLTLVKPRLGHSADGSYRDKAVMEPLALAIVAALTPPDVEVAFYDERLEGIPFDEPTDLVALTVETFTARRAYEISAEYRKRGVPVVLGGYHPSHLPEEAGLHADSVYIGDAEGRWAEVIADARAGALKPRYRAPIGILQQGTLPRREIFRGKKYLPITLVQFSRGCSFDCNFCSVSTFYERTFFHRPVRDVIEEIERQDRSLILFVDDNIVMNHTLAKELFRELAPLGIRWFSEGDINMSRDRELMRLMMRSGCKGHLIGFESVEEESLRAMGKHPNFAGFNGYREQLKVLREHGVLLWAAFTLGHAHDTTETFGRTLEFATRQKFALADFNVLMPYPNTPLYRELAAENRLLFDGAWWLHPDFRFGKSAHVPHGMTADELAEGCYGARREYFRMGSILRRALDLKTNLGSPFNAMIYGLANFLSYNDGLKKQDVVLGGG